MTLISSVRGMRDLLPADTGEWRRVESAAADCFARYGYGEIRTPVVERAELFRRQLGEDSDIVQKEMYAFADLSGDELCLRPEATVPAVRAAAAANLHRGGVARVWYGGPMFRRERPQKDRYRQFWQLGAEAIGAGAPDPAIDAEQILMAARLWRELKVDSSLQLFINNLGAPAERAAYRKKLSAHFRRRAADLDDSARARIDDNPMRILDGKDAAAVAAAKDAPQLREFLGAESRRHLEEVQNILAAAGIEFTETPSLVRGLDYYNLTVFEWALKDDGRRQNALCGGGRYDGLSAQIGGPPLHGCGFALGLDRLVALTQSSAAAPPDCILLAAGGGAEYCIRAAESLRDGGISVRRHDGGGNIGKQLKKADAAGSPLAAIVGENEEKCGTIAIKRMRDGAQKSPPLARAAAVAAAFLAGDDTENNDE
ncbi:MAG: histidine--tRNA ligase [Gammaproteobacteria bacterium]